MAGIEPAAPRSQTECATTTPHPIKGTDGRRESAPMPTYPLPDSNRDTLVPKTNGFTNLPKRASLRPAGFEPTLAPARGCSGPLNYRRFRPNTGATR